MKRKLFTFFLLFTLLVSLGLTACHKQYFYAYYQKMDKEGWRTKKELFYSFNVEDTTALYDIYIDIRYTEKYPYTNIVLGIVSETNNRTYLTETKELRFHVPESGISKGGYHFFVKSEPLYLNRSFSASGIQTISFQHLMTDSLLLGIEEIGVRVMKSDMTP
ncbi:MAG: gliding motility lipoprotein GldH [Porphyromonas sp.]|nr:gliding motility lipoprotein GldH [Porphyromonas sp.]